MDPEEQTTIIQKISCASEGEVAQVGYVAKLRIWKDEQNQQKSVLGSYEIGAHELNANIEPIVTQMRVGDTWKIQQLNKITSKLEKLNISLVSLQKSQANLPASANGRAEEFKKQGNAAIKQQKYHEAIDLYKKAFQLVEYCCDKEAVEIRNLLMSNIAQGTLSSYRYRQCLEWCQRCMSEFLEPSKKIVYRQISAYKGLRQWELAKQKVGQALLLFKNDQEATAEFQALKETIEKQQKQETVRQKKVYTNMFG